MRRRTLLQASLGGFVASSGCSSFRRPDVVRVALAEVANLDDARSHTIGVQFTYDGATIYDDSHTLEPTDGIVASSVAIEDVFPDEPGRYQVTATLDTLEEPQHLNVSEFAEGECTYVLIEAFDSRKLGITCTENCFGREGTETTESG